MWAPIDEKANVQMLVKMQTYYGEGKRIILDVHLEGKKQPFEKVEDTFGIKKKKESQGV